MIRRNASLPAVGFAAGSLLSLGLVGCGGSTEQNSETGTDAGGDGAANSGSINAEFRLPSGSASTASYTLTGPEGYSLASTLDFQGSQAIGFLIEGVPAGSGYTLAFTATDGADAGLGESCTGSTSIVVTAEKTSMVDLVATCTGGPYVPMGYGTVDTWVSFPRGLSLAAAACSLIGPAGIETNGPVEVSGTSDLHFALQHVPAGDRQVITITASASNGEQCEANAPIDVGASATAEAMLLLQCK